MQRGLRGEIRGITDEASMATFDIDKISKVLDNIMPKIMGDKAMIVIGDEPKLVEDIYFNRDKEENWEIERKAEEHGLRNSEDMVYLGSNIGMKVEITEKHIKVLELQGIDVSDKNIFI